MDQTGKKRFFSMAKIYDEMVQILVPQYDFIQDEVLRILSVNSAECSTLVDLGAGSGILLDKILKSNSSVQCCWVDYSENFLEVAKEKLSKHGDRVKYILSPIEEDWESQIPGNAGVILSMSAIHHLETWEKQELYRRCYEKLNHGGWFFNIDEMKTIYDDAYLGSLHFWIKHVEEEGNRIPHSSLSYYEKWKSHFDNWKKRNVDNIDRPKTKGDDIHESFMQQIQWLREAGFINTDLFIKYHLWCAIGGQKGPPE